MVQTTTGSPLVAGTIGSTDNATMRVKAIRGFMYQGAAVRAGTEVDLPRAVGLEVISSHKAEPVERKVPAEAQSVESEPMAEGVTEGGSDNPRPRRGRPPKAKETEQ